LFPPDGFTPALVVFDKDGTLIDFNFMWASWLVELAGRLERASGAVLAAELYRAMGYDAARHAVIAGAPLAAHSMANLYILTGRVVCAQGVPAAETERVLNDAWFVPDPIALARPLADLPKLFSALRARDILIGIATSDDRKATIATLRALKVNEMVDAVVCADDGLPNKPALDMLLQLCQTLAVPAAHTALVGDAVVDLEMGRRAGAARVIAVLTGLADETQLAPHADLILPSVAALV